MSTGAGSSTKRKAPEPDAAPAAAAATQEQARRRRRGRAKLRGYGDEFMDMNVEVDPGWGAPPDAELVGSTVASDHGAGDLGFAGAVCKEAVVDAAGLTTLTGDGFGGGPILPMTPATWGSGQREQLG